MVRAVRDQRYKYIRNYNPHQIYGQFIAYMFQTDTTRIWKNMFDAGKLNEVQSAFWKTKPAIEFYDTRNDPHEVNNLAQSEAHADQRDRLADELDRWQLEIGDLGFLPEGEMHDRCGDLTPYELGRDKKKYPLAKIKAAAEKATTATSSSLGDLQSMMKDKDAAIRYWGATGCIILGKGATAAKSDLVNLCKDPCADVRSAASQALFMIGEVKTAESTLEAILSEKNPFSRLRAMNVLDHMDESAREAVTRIAKVGDPVSIGAYGENYIGNVINKAAADLGVAQKKKRRKK
jgi:hypothetical protein